MADTTTLRLFDHHASGLQTGNYTLTLSQALTAATPSPESAVRTLGKPHPGHGDLSEAQVETLEYAFEVGQEHRQLTDSQIAGLYPPPNSEGPYSHHLPHVLLHSTTLPWETWPYQGQTGDPFLFLMFLDEEEATQVVEETVTQEDGNAAYTTITLPSALLRQFFPEPLTADALLSTLRPLVHVRQQLDAKGQPLQQRACLLGNRLPKPNQTSVVHVVSLAHSPGGHFLTEQLAQPHITLYSLLKYSFTTAQAPDFLDTLRALSVSPIHTRKGETTGVPDLAAQAMAQAYLPLPHHQRNGTSRVSLYRGPLMPIAPSQSSLPGPATSADQLLRRHPSLGLMEVSHAAAWSLGRFLMLHSRTLLRALVQWKRQHVQQSKQAAIAQQLADTGALTFQPPQAPVAIPQALPQALVDVLHGWMTLMDIPMANLLPEAAMLPEGHLRTFQLDLAWMHALLNGAFEVAFAGIADPQRSTALWEQFWQQAQAAWPQQAIPKGVVLHSPLLSDFPDLQVFGRNAKGETIEPMRIIREGNVLLALFPAQVSQVIFSLPDHSMHAGVARARSGQGWELALQGEPTPEEAHQPVATLDDQATILDIPKLVQQIPFPDQPEATGAAKLGFHLLKKGAAVAIPLTTS